VAVAVASYEAHQGGGEQTGHDDEADNGDHLGGGSDEF
jgi:hypothetical protein